jgi:hypothetical protein
MAAPFTGTVWTITDAAGNPVPGAKVRTYEAGTLTDKAVYTSASLATPASNPVIADASGRVQFFPGSGLYRYKVFTSDDVELTAYAADNVSAADNITADLAASSGSSLVGYVNSGTGATERTVQDRLRESVSVKDFGAVGDGTADDTAAIAAAWTASKSLIFPAGTYKATSLPNFASNGARVRGIGEVWINFIGTGNAMTLDNGSTPGGKNYNILIENIGINGTATCTHGVYMRGITHSTLRRVRVRNVATAALRAEFLVSNLFDEFTCSGNEGGFTTIPVKGIILEKRGTGEQCSDNTWINPVIEGTSGDGMVLNEAAMNTFVGGTSEGNGFGGGAGAIYIGAASFGNTFIGMDLEVNGASGDATSYHVKDYGLRTKFINPFCDSTLSGLFWVAGGNSCSIDGGAIADLTIDAGVKNFMSVGMAYTGTITDNGTNSRHMQRFSVGGATVDIVDSQMAATAWTPTVSGLTVVGTPTYTGTYQKMGRLVMFTITATSTTTTANPGAATFTLPIAATALGTCAAASNTTGLGLGAGSGSISATLCYPPTWSADASVTISGVYFAA